MRKFSLPLLLASVLILEGCAVAVVAGAAGAASAANDRRSIGAQIDDNNIEVKAELLFSEHASLREHSNISIVSFNGVVLLVGQAPNDQLRDLAAKTVADIIGVKKIHNQIRIGSSTSITTKTNDAWLTSKVKTQLLSDEQVAGLNIKVVTENAEVFLMGLATMHEADKAVDIARNISGVGKVVKVFEYL
ncbi:division/outer membrane stress-associated lipid-binding lipoprotein [Flocculibacter collagenilyticus]|uniref:division/outer membrane stress-associated lipid-binding lipoprotein n=1 Tax=Flocculibacter collagenilyticus TaxID=2744479 RepID=UPI0018F49649|nr:division/outer membrane stress-associated lipid-binding lipoprotein [Flocculibacter collagenilyticus]